MELKTSIAHRNLDAKLKIFGFEIYDLLAILLFASIMNLLFGTTNLSLLFVFVLPGVFGLIIHIGKRNKPDGFLIHFARYHLLPEVFSSGSPSQYQIQSSERIWVEVYETKVNKI